jgi:hypothetical protein
MRGNMTIYNLADVREQFVRGALNQETHNGLYCEKRGRKYRGFAGFHHPDVRKWISEQREADVPDLSGGLMPIGEIYGRRLSRWEYLREFLICYNRAYVALQYCPSPFEEISANVMSDDEVREIIRTHATSVRPNVFGHPDYNLRSVFTALFSEWRHRRTRWREAREWICDRVDAFVATLAAEQEQRFEEALVVTSRGYTPRASEIIIVSKTALTATLVHSWSCGGKVVSDGSRRARWLPDGKALADDGATTLVHAILERCRDLPSGDDTRELALVLRERPHFIQWGPRENPSGRVALVIPEDRIIGERPTGGTIVPFPEPAIVGDD